MEYLTDGILEPLDVIDPRGCLTALISRLTLDEYKVASDIPVREAAPVQHIGSYDYNPLIIAQFAAKCYQAGKAGTPEISPTSSLGMLIR